MKIEEELFFVRIWIMLASILLILVVGMTNINTDFILLGLIVVLAVCVVTSDKLNKSVKIVFNVAIFITLVSAVVMSNILEGKSLVMYLITSLLICIHIRFLKTKSTNDKLEPNEN